METNRFDVTELTLGKNVKETAQGFLVIPAFTARTGIQSYRNADGSVIKEYRPENEVFSEKSMESLRTAPVTDGHPKDMVSPENAHELILGHTDGFIQKETDGDEQFLKTSLIVTHKKGIDAIRAGKAQLSNGYSVDLEFTPGEYNGQKYDAVQKNIINNHIAIVWRARAGEKASLRLDENDAVLITDSKSKKENKFMKLKIGDKEFEVADELGKAIKGEMSKMSKGKKDSDDTIEELKLDQDLLKSRNTKMVAKIDSLESELEKKDEPKMDEKEIEKRVQERISTLDSGKKVLDSETIEKLDSMSNEEIKIAIIKSDSKNVSDEKLKNSEYVNARYDHIIEKFDTSKEEKKKIEKELENKKDEDDSNKYLSPDEIRKMNMDSYNK